MKFIYHKILRAHFKMMAIEMMCIKNKKIKKFIFKGENEMALIYCSECGRQVSDQAEYCPGCGNVIKGSVADAA